MVWWEMIESRMPCGVWGAGLAGKRGVGVKGGGGPRAPRLWAEAEGRVRCRRRLGPAWGGGLGTRGWFRGRDRPGVEARAWRPDGPGGRRAEVETGEGGNSQRGVTVWV